MPKNRLQTLYIAFILLLGGIVLGFCAYRAVLQLCVAQNPSIVIGDLFVITLLFVLCRSLPVYIADNKSIEVSFVPVVASALTLGPDVTILFFAFSTLFLFERDSHTHTFRYSLARNPRAELFNLGNILLSVFAGSSMLYLLGGTGGALRLPYSILPATLFAVVTILMNLILFVLYFVSEGDQNFFTLFFGNILDILPNILCTIPFGILIALLLKLPNGSAFVLLFMLPLLLARYSFKLYLDSKSMYLRTVSSLSMAIEAKDTYTRGHSQRVSAMSVELARAMHLRPAEVEEIKIAALLHDIGKIGVEDSVLNKPAALTPEEFAEIKQHPVIGRKIVEDIHLSDTVNNAILFHHCRFDGAGYPADGPGPGKLSVAAAILAVADTFDAMTSDRPYRKGLPYEAAIAEIKLNSGTQFDPAVVAHLEEALKDFTSQHPETVAVGAYA